MRDHLLGCYQFQADLAHVQPTAVGVPNRLKRAPLKVKDTSVRDFEAGDKTPVSMHADFPHEYDLHTMYGDAAKDAYRKTKNWLYGDFAEPEPWIPVKDVERAENEQRTASGLLLPQEAAKRQLDAAFGSARTVEQVKRQIEAAVFPSEEDRATIVARILADKQALRPGKRAKKLALDDFPLGL